MNEMDTVKDLASRYSAADLQAAFWLAVQKEAKAGKSLPYVDLSVIPRARLEAMDGTEGYLEVVAPPEFGRLCSLPRDSRTLAVRCSAGRIVVRSDHVNQVGVSWEET